MERTCCHCGASFRSPERQIVCSDCRKPRGLNLYEKHERPLTAREQQVAELIAHALGNKEIAWELKLSDGTIKVYLNHMMAAVRSKLQASNRVALAVWWVTEGRAEYHQVQTSAKPEAA